MSECRVVIADIQYKSPRSTAEKGSTRSVGIQPSRNSGTRDGRPEKKRDHPKSIEPERSAGVWKNLDGVRRKRGRPRKTVGMGKFVKPGRFNDRSRHSVVVQKEIRRKRGRPRLKDTFASDEDASTERMVKPGRQHQTQAGAVQNLHATKKRGRPRKRRFAGRGSARISRDALQSVQGKNLRTTDESLDGTDLLGDSGPVRVLRRSGSLKRSTEECSTPETKKFWSKPPVSKRRKSNPRVVQEQVERKRGRKRTVSVSRDKGVASKARRRSGAVEAGSSDAEQHVPDDLDILAKLSVFAQLANDGPTVCIQDEFEAVETADLSSSEQGPRADDNRSDSKGPADTKCVSALESGSFEDAAVTPFSADSGILANDASVENQNALIAASAMEKSESPSSETNEPSTSTPDQHQSSDKPSEKLKTESSKMETTSRKPSDRSSETTVEVLDQLLDTECTKSHIEDARSQTADTVDHEEDKNSPAKKEHSDASAELENSSATDASCDRHEGTIGGNDSISVCQKGATDEDTKTHVTPPWVKKRQAEIEDLATTEETPADMNKECLANRNTDAIIETPSHVESHEETADTDTEAAVSAEITEKGTRSDTNNECPSKDLAEGLGPDFPADNVSSNDVADTSCDVETDQPAIAQKEDHPAVQPNEAPPESLNRSGSAACPTEIELTDDFKTISEESDSTPSNKVPATVSHSTDSPCLHSHEGRSGSPIPTSSDEPRVSDSSDDNHEPSPDPCGRDCDASEPDQSQNDKSDGLHESKGSTTVELSDYREEFGEDAELVTIIFDEDSTD